MHYDQLKKTFAKTLQTLRSTSVIEFENLNDDIKRLEHFIIQNVTFLFYKTMLANWFTLSNTKALLTNFENFKVQSYNGDLNIILVCNSGDTPDIKTSKQ